MSEVARCPRCGRFILEADTDSGPGAVRVRCPDCHAHILIVRRDQYGAVLYIGGGKTLVVKSPEVLDKPPEASVD